MKTNRLEAFSDGVLAIIITIMVLELEAPKSTHFQALIPKIPLFLSYLVSFVFLGIYWNNHHHLLQVTERVNGKILWANLHLLFWLSLVPFSTAWIGHNIDSTPPVALYGVILFMSAVAFRLLQRTILAAHDEDFILRKFPGEKRKADISIALYLTGIVAAFFFPVFSLVCYVLVALFWFVPNKELEW